MALTCYVIGSGQDGGLPQFGARTMPDMQARLDPLARRLGPSLALLEDSGRCLIIDVSPDIKEQEDRLLKIPAYSARKSEMPCDGVILTHAHMGHYAGLVHFGRESANTQDLPVWCSETMANFLRTNAPWEQLVTLKNINLETDIAEFEPWEGLRIRTFFVPHRGEYTDTIGISINDKLLYVPDIDGWKQWPNAREEIARHEICLLDATFFNPDELPNRDLNEISHPFIADTLEFFKEEVTNHRLILTHFNHSNPVCDPASKAAQAVTAAGFELAQEMTAIKL
ncbi:MBL fold metallo-hydrolase [Planctomycetota bacterium]|nr:MBL fold metallo-hydrolase [Planctomycetota bacterium]